MLSFVLLRCDLFSHLIALLTVPVPRIVLRILALDTLPVVGRPQLGILVWGVLGTVLGRITAAAGRRRARTEAAVVSGRRAAPGRLGLLQDKDLLVDDVVLKTKSTVNASVA